MMFKQVQDGLKGATLGNFDQPAMKMESQGSAQGSFKDVKVMWTALPQGTYDLKGQKYARVGVFVSIRLRSAIGTNLSEFPEFLDWPGMVKGMHFALDFGGTKLVDAEVISAPSSDLWKALFKSSTYVEPFQFDDFSKNLIHSYPVLAVAGLIRSKYLDLAISSPTDLPKRSEVRAPGSFGNFHFKRGEEEQMREKLAAHMKRDRALKMSDLEMMGAPGKAAMLQSKMFHEVKIDKPVPLPKYPQDAAKFEEMLDFHRMLAALANYPEMMRRLGLLIELRIPASEVPGPGKGAPGWVALVSKQFSQHDHAHRTAYLFDDRRFMPRPRDLDPIYQWGMMQFQDLKKYGAVRYDVDGGAIKVMDFADAMEKMESKKSQDTPEEQGAPALRSGSLTVFRIDKGAQMAATFKASKALQDELEKNSPALLHAEDVARGYRIDAWDSTTGQWHSLNFRQGKYTYLDKGNNEQLIDDKIVDEGWVQTGATQSPDPNATPQQKDFFVHESLFNWKGWSLSVTRPGKVIDPQDEVATIDPVLATQLKLKASFIPVKGTLPRLRYGTRYRFRARMVDLGGFGLTLQEADSNNATAEVDFLRFDPIPPPVVTLRENLDLDVRCGESLERLVIRSFNEDQKKDDHECKETAERHVAPPRTSQMDAELHGMLDDPKTGQMRMDQGTYDLLAEKDKGKLKASKTGDPICEEKQLELPYLPDPMAKGVWISHLPGQQSQMYQYQNPNPPAGAGMQRDFGELKDWPGMLPFRIRLAEGTDEPKWDDGERLLTVYLPKAGVAKFKVSCYPPQDKLGWMGIWKWVEEAKAHGKIDQMKFNHLLEHALHGRHWMISPFRWVHLMHAVQQPLGRPEIPLLFPQRMKGKTWTHLSGGATVDGKSSIKMEMMARWEERKDVPEEPTNDPVKDRISGSAMAFDMHLEPKDVNLEFLNDRARRHDFGDTIYRQVRYRAVTTTRFREYMPKNLTKNTKTKFTRESEEVEVDVPSSAKPALPRIAYVVPLFGWKLPVPTPLGTKSERKGNALRVYLERPWFSSGDGEKLAVILHPGKLPQSEDELDRVKPYVTMCAQDPLWKSKQTPINLALADFKNRHAESRSGLPLDELDHALVDVAVFDVDYDHDKGKWFADIEVDMGGSYTPFIRLALARFQFNSVDTVHLSPVVQADFAQVAPDRTMTVIKSPAAIKVTLTGHAYSAYSGGEGTVTPGGPAVEVELQRYEKAIGTDLGWVKEPNAKVVADIAMPGSGLYSGTVTLPPPPTVVKGQPPLPPPRYRLVVKEFEPIAQDAKALEGYHLSSFPLEPGKRLVYVDYVEL